MTIAEQRRRYVLVIPVPREVEIRIEDRFLALSGATKPLMGYHITLLGAFLLPENATSQTRKMIQQACQAVEPFQITIGGIGAFEKPGNHAIYIAVTESEPIKTLQRSLWQTLAQSIAFANEGTRAWNLPENFHPHVTLGLGLSDAEYRAFLDSDTASGCAASFTATHINLVAQDADGPWQSLAHFSLGQDPAPNSGTERY